MKIGYDGKRAYQNKTGLGNYIRSLIAILTKHYPEQEYVLFAPKKTALFNEKEFVHTSAVFPKSHAGRRFPSLWRSRWMLKDIVNAKIDVFHGVSHQLPAGINKTTVKSVVTVHDLIFERFPDTYHFDERYVHRWKIKHACKVADAIVAISKQTKDDLINYYHIREQKITVCYQSCNPIFQRKVDAEEKSIVKKRYGLPDEYFLFVSSVAPRKNLIAVCKAMIMHKSSSVIPLVIIGNGKKEKEEVKLLMHENGIGNRLIFLNELPQSKEDNFTSAHDFPAIYQQAIALIYPSIFEGFGAPLLEAMWSGLPVICSNTSCLPEVGGDAAAYFDPHDYQQISSAMLQVASDAPLRKNMIEKGFIQAGKFTTQQYAADMMAVYKKLV